MRSKQLLRQCRQDIRELVNMMDRQAFLRGTLLPAAIRAKEVDVQTSGAGDRMSEVVPKIVELDRKIDEHLNALIKAQLRVEAMIDAVDDARYRALLRWYYLSYPPLSWRQVADKMGYSEITVKRMHGYALLKVPDSEDDTE